MNDESHSGSPGPMHFPTNVSAELAARINAFDWAATSLGPIETWPQSLRTSLSILLGSRFPMQLLWGSEYVHFYNDAYLPIAAGKHPAALGRQGAEIWPEVWDVVHPMLEQVRTTGDATWSDDQLLVLNRRGASEESYFTFSYSPVSGEAGAVDGIFIAVTETTRRVIGERRLRAARDLSAVLAGVPSEEQVYTLVCEHFERAAVDLPLSAIYVIDDTGLEARLACATGLAAGHPLTPERQPLGEEAPGDPWPIPQAIAAREAVLVKDVPQAPPLPPWDVPPHTALVLPLLPGASGRPIGCLVAGVSPHIPLDVEYREFLERVAAQVSSAVVAARAYTAASNEVRLRDDFLSIAAHELKTPLTPIVGKLQLMQRRLAREGVDQRHIESLASISAEAARLSAMIDALLDVSRLRSGQLSIARAPLDLRAVTTSMAEAIQPTLTEHTFLLEYDADPVLVDGDAIRLEQVVRNLVSNALKYSPDGGTVALSVMAQADKAVLTVRDQGIGVAPEELGRLFERYYRADNVATYAVGGLGVGLFVVHEIVRLHGGTIAVESTLGAGSTFTMRLPLRQMPLTH